MSEDTLAPPRHESRDIGPGFAIRGVLLMAAVLLLTALVLAWIFPATIDARLVAGRLPAAPSPALQSSPRADMARFYAQEMQYLHGTGWVDRGAGRVHIPIEDAMHRLARQGIKDWPGASQ